MPRPQAATRHLIALLREASELAKEDTLANRMRVGPMLAAMIQDLLGPVVADGKIGKSKPR